MKLLFLFLLTLPPLMFGCDNSIKSPAGYPVESIIPVTKGELPSVIPESSGLIVTQSGNIWTHNDSGNSNELFQIDSNGNLLRTLIVSNVRNIDWEDLAADRDGNIYICDTGNNDNDRRDLAIYRIPDPDTVEGDEITALVINISYEDQKEFPPLKERRNFCVEGVVWSNDSLYLFTKDRSEPLTGYTKMYAVPDKPSEYTLAPIDSLFIDENERHMRVTGADINFKTGEMVLLTRSGILSFTNYPKGRFFEGDIKQYVFTNDIGQSEGIAFYDSKTLYITSEEDDDGFAYIFKVKLP
ncbi:SdiA-regulated domain-containing protein [Marinilabiliaceae bacterium ANBcel2]|nr:SdiA-regulated domain-containing protein [Marinilabiliaceae bacterium ANBcel2]